MLCKNCGAVFMEGSPYCPNCNEPMTDVKSEKKLSVSNKGKMSGDVLLTENYKVVFSSDDNKNSSADSSYDKPTESFKNKSYRLTVDENPDSNTQSETSDYEPFHYEDVIESDIDENKNFDSNKIPQWKIKQEEKKQKRNIRSAHEIGNVQGGKILPPGLSPEDFMILQNMSKIRYPYFLSVFICYIWTVLLLIYIVLFARGDIISLILELFVISMTLLIQMRRSRVASAALIVIGLIYFALMLPYTFSAVSVLVVVFSGFLALRSTVYFDKLYKNYLKTQTIPDDYRMILKIKN